MSHTNSTPNYALPQFLSSDKPAWMADINVAFADIDAQMKLNEDAADQANTDIGTVDLNFAAGYSNLSTYDVGDIVTYNKRMYQCDIAVTIPEAFDSGKWSYYRVSNAIYTANSAESGVNALNTLVGNTDISAIGDGTVTGAIDTLNSNLANNAFSSITNIISYNSVGNQFTVPTDGYVKIEIDEIQNHYGWCYINNAKLISLGNPQSGASSTYKCDSLFVRKGMTIYVDGTGLLTAEFIALG